jgi:hypothetical protein
MYPKDEARPYKLTFGTGSAGARLRNHCGLCVGATLCGCPVPGFPGWHGGQPIQGSQGTGGHSLYQKDEAHPYK